MVIETERLILREMTTDDYDALYAVLADSDIMQHYPYTFDEKRVRGWITKVYAITREEWEKRPL
ncbi:MAG: GNAT family N-acetyltransferase [Lachnospiraceae bacterium]|nr:GNAT family N-acetyltransferase [Lachnospiraceae bacterium]